MFCPLPFLRAACTVDHTPPGGLGLSHTGFLSASPTCHVPSSHAASQRAVPSIWNTPSSPFISHKCHLQEIFSDAHSSPEVSLINTLIPMKSPKYHFLQGNFTFIQWLFDWLFAPSLYTPENKESQGSCWEQGLRWVLLPLGPQHQGQSLMHQRAQKITGGWVTSESNPLKFVENRYFKF